MLYSKKVKLDRRNSIMAAVRKELKANNVYVAPELLKALAEALVTSVYYDIEVVRDAEKAGKILRLKDHETEHSWAGDYGVKEECMTVVFGTITMGEDYFYEFFDNGDSRGPSESKTDGGFDVNKPFAFLRHTEDWKDWNDEHYNRRYDTIVIYSPAKIIDEKAYVAARDAELAELCQLRKSRYNLPNALA